MSTLGNNPIVNFNSSKIVAIENREDRKEDLEDFPPVPSSMVLPDGTCFPVRIRYLKSKKLKKITKKRKKEKRDKKNRTTMSPEELLQDIAEEIDEFFHIYDIFIEEQDLPTKINRIIKWLTLKLVGADLEANEYEALWKKEDGRASANKVWREHITKAIAEIKALAVQEKFDISIEELSEHILEDLESFYKTSIWEGIVSEYCQNPFDTEWFSPENNYLTDTLKDFLLKKYKAGVLTRYKTFFSANPCLANNTTTVSAMRSFQKRIDEALKLYLNKILQAEEVYHKDLKKIELHRNSPYKRKNWITKARKTLYSFLSLQ